VADSVERRLVFGSVAERYDRHRPGYPPEMVDAILEYGGLNAGDRALEVGAGTGIATRLFAARGLRITAIEPDSAMAAVASQRAATDGTSVDVQLKDFEHAELEDAGYRLLYAGTAWHWVTPDSRYVLAARVLASGGALAAFWNRPVWTGNPVRPGLDRAYRPVSGAFAKIFPGPMHPDADATVMRAADWEHELAAAPAFTDLQTATFRWQQPYARDEYIGLLGTHSDHILLPEADRERLFEGVAAAIDELGGSFELTYEVLLCLARRR
jgi:SAM-dependent methyltransferase